MLQNTSFVYFREVAELGSIRKAAERLHISPSAISRMIAKLERQFQSDLFERRTKGMRLTPAGRILMVHLNEVLFQLKNARTEVDELKGLRRGEICIYCIEGLFHEILPDILTKFHRSYPDITFSIYSAGTDRIVEALLSDTADIGITFNMRRNVGITSVASHVEAMHALASPSHPLAKLRRVSLRQLSQYAVTMPDASFGVRNLLDQALRKKRISLPMMVTTNSLELTRRLSQAGPTITITPPFSARGELGSGELIAIPIIENHMLRGSMTLCVRRGRRLSAGATELIKAISSEFRAMDRRSTKPSARKRR